MNTLITQNRGLAIALFAAGVPVQMQNVYTPEMLTKWGFKRAVDAVKARKWGRVEFLITKTPRVQQLIAAYNEQMETVDTVTLDDDVEDDIRIVRSVCHSQKFRRAIEEALSDPANAWEEYGGDNTQAIEFNRKESEIRAKLAVRPGSDPQDVLTPDELFFITNPHSITMGGFKFINALLSEEKRKHLGL